MLTLPYFNGGCDLMTQHLCIFMWPSFHRARLIYGKTVCGNGIKSETNVLAMQDNPRCGHSTRKSSCIKFHGFPLRYKLTKALQN